LPNASVTGFASSGAGPWPWPSRPCCLVTGFIVDGKKNGRSCASITTFTSYEQPRSVGRGGGCPGYLFVFSWAVGCSVTGEPQGGQCSAVLNS
jgi:hypothetical protein